MKRWTRHGPAHGPANMLDARFRVEHDVAGTGWVVRDLTTGRLADGKRYPTMRRAKAVAEDIAARMRAAS